jgi:hypothetical protein
LVVSTTWSCAVSEAAAAWRRKDSIEISKWTNAGERPCMSGSGDEFEMTQSLVSGETYGRAWNARPGRSANVAGKNSEPDSSGERSASGARLPFTTRAISLPPRSMKHASPIPSGYSRSIACSAAFARSTAGPPVWSFSIVVPGA